MVGDKLIMEIKMLTKNFLEKFFAGAFYQRFRKLLNKVNSNTNHAYQKRNTPIAIKNAVSLWPEYEKSMSDLYENPEEYTSTSQ